MSIRAATIPMLPAVLILWPGCMAWSDPVDRKPTDYRDLSDAATRGELVREGYDRERVRRTFGAPAVASGDEWAYVAKFEDVVCVPLTVDLSAYDDVRPNWKLTVVTFGPDGRVSGVRAAAVDSDIAEGRNYWTLFNVHVDKGGRVRQAAATRPGDRP